MVGGGRPWGGAESQWLLSLSVQPRCQSQEEAGQQLASHTLLAQKTSFMVAGHDVAS